MKHHKNFVFKERNHFFQIFYSRGFHQSKARNWEIMNKKTEKIFLFSATKASEVGKEMKYNRNQNFFKLKNILFQIPIQTAKNGAEMKHK